MLQPRFSVFRQLSTQSVRNRQPPAMRVGSNGYTKKFPNLIQYSCSSLLQKRGEFLWQIKQIVYQVQHGCVNIT